MNWTITPLAYTYILAVTLFVGKIVTFSFLVAPLVHVILGREDAAKLLRVFFPRYYKFGIGCAIVALLSGMLFAYSASMGRIYQWLIFWGLALIIEVFSLQVLVPILESTREARNNGEVEATRKFEWAHKTSVYLNAINLLIGLVLVWFYLGGTRAGL